MSGKPRSKHLYSVWDRLLERGSDKYDVKEVKTEWGDHYKHIRLTEAGIRSGEKSRIKNASRNLRAYTSTSCVPPVVHVDEEQLIVQWIDGAPLNTLELEESDYAALGGFVASCLRDVEYKNNDSILEKIRTSLDALVKWGVVSEHLYQSATGILDGKIKIPERVPEAICFGDTTLKNFVRDKNGDYHYIDIFGIYRAEIGLVFAKQLSMIPTSYRRAFSQSYQQALPFPGIELNLPFYLFAYLVIRTYAKSKKPGLLHRLRGKRKARLALSNLDAFLQAAQEECDLTAWIMDASMPESVHWYQGIF